MRERNDVVLLYAPPWAGPTRFSKHHLARLFAEHGHRVLYVEAPLTPLGLRRGQAFLRELRETLQPPRQVLDRVWVRRHLLLVPYHAVSRLTETRAASRIGQRLLAPQLRRDLRRLGFLRPLVIAGLPPLLGRFFVRTRFSQELARAGSGAMQAGRSGHYDI